MDACPVYGSIDMGSHTIRLLIAGIHENGLVHHLHLQRRITRLARGFHEGQTLQPDAMQESIQALEEYAAALRRFQVNGVSCGATGVLRRAFNASDFLHEVKKATGLEVSVLSEAEEAFLSAKGCLSVLPDPKERVLSFDLGGSSTEFLLMDPSQTEPLWSTSVFMGASTLTERHLAGDPPQRSQIIEAAHTARRELAPALLRLGQILAGDREDQPAFHLVGTAGTATTLAAMFLQMTVYEPYRVNGLVLGRKWLDETVELLAHLSMASRRHLSGLENGREDIILGGALIVREVLEGLAQTCFTVADGGLLEGIFLDHAEKEEGLKRCLLSPFRWHLPDR